MSAWVEPDPADLINLRSERSWARLANRYVNYLPRPYRQCLQIARASGAQTVVVETRYMDQDYRSEFSAFFSRTFADVADTAQRLHFFRARLRPSELATLPKEPSYLGYMVIRPSPLGRVGRTMLLPPPKIRGSVQCAVDDQVSFFGQTLTVRGVPFAQQDTQFGRCAHVAAWICHYTASLRNDTTRHPMAEFALRADPSVAEGRPFPSQGLTGLQLSNLMRDLGLPPIVYRMGRLPVSGQEPPVPLHEADDHPGTWDTRAIAVVCRFLNSRYPVLVGTADHAFVLVGYHREKTGDRDWIHFVRHDDQRGPYLPVTNILNDSDVDSGDCYGPWEMMLAPVPEKLWLLPEAAERSGRDFLLSLDALENTPVLTKLADDKRLTFRTYATSASDYKARAAGRRLGIEAVRELRLARLSRMVWVVEAVDRKRRATGGPSVLGEAVFDSTSSDTVPKPLLIRVPGAMLITRTDGGVRYPLRATRLAVRSGAATEP